jgi:hypothetical protein
MIFEDTEPISERITIKIGIWCSELISVKRDFF